MNFLLKIVEGPNKGAEIALVSGVAVTFGTGDDCDIVLADPTFPSAPIAIEASDGGVTVDGEPLAPFTVKTVGATSFAVGPSDEPWGELKWTERAESRTSAGEGTKTEDRRGGSADEGSPRTSSPAPGEGATESNGKPRRRGGCCGCLVAFALLILALAGLAWFYRAAIMEFCEAKGYDVHAFPGFAAPADKPEGPAPAEQLTLAVVAARHGLTVEEGDGTVKITGNLKTRAARLRATAEAYEARPGVELDLSDDESFRSAAEDALFTLTEGALKVVSATNRVLSIRGVARSPGALKHTLEALDADLPRLRSVDATGVAFAAVASRAAQDEGREEVAPAAATRDSRSMMAKRADHFQPLPVCGILTKPYPCLVLRDGSRVLEGASMNGNVILKIDADMVTITNSTGRFTWKP